MQNCVYCGTPTVLYINALPVCIQCDDRISKTAEAKSQPDQPRVTKPKERRVESRRP
jgi:hypothetical protein